MQNTSFRTAFLRSLFFVILISRSLAGAAQPSADNPGTEGDGAFTIGPEYKIDPDLTDRGNPKGKIFEFSMPLAASKVFKGDDSTLQPEKKAVRTERRINVYV